MDDFAHERNKVKRLPQRAQYDKETVYRIVGEAPEICHVGFTKADQPIVIPMLHARIGDTLYFHECSRKPGCSGLIAAGHPMCAAFTLLDGLVFARSVFHHSVNYRSAVIFGTGRLVESDEEKLTALEALTEHIAPGRWGDAPAQPEGVGCHVRDRAAHRERLGKIRIGPPSDDEADYSLPVWAGVVPLQLRALNPIDDPKLSAGIEAPSYVVRYGNSERGCIMSVQESGIAGRVCPGDRATAGIGFATAPGPGAAGRRS